MKNSIISILALASFVLVTNGLKANQFKGKNDSLACLLIEGRIVSSEEETDGDCTVELITNDGEIDSLYLQEGKIKFKFLLSKNNYYALRISKKGYIPKLIAVDTEIGIETFGIYKFSFDATLVRQEAIKFMNPDMLDFPVAIVHFDYENECFSYNKEYTERMKKELHNVSPARKRIPSRLDASAAVQRQ